MSRIYLLPFGVERLPLLPGETVLRARPSAATPLELLSDPRMEYLVRLAVSPSGKVSVTVENSGVTSLRVRSLSLESLVRLDVFSAEEVLSVTIENSSPPDMWALCRRERKAREHHDAH
jgi:hypothetical protein